MFRADSAGSLDRDDQGHEPDLQRRQPGLSPEDAGSFNGYSDGVYLSIVWRMYVNIYIYIHLFIYLFIYLL